MPKATHRPKLALIPPIDLLEYTDQTRFQLMLPHLVDDQRYAYTYKRHCKDPWMYIILDNGVAEAVDFDTRDLLLMALDYRPDELVIPDVMQDAMATISKAVQFLDRISRLAEDELFFQRLNYMFVIQGKTMNDFRRCVEFASTHTWISTIGIPRHAIMTLGELNVRSELAQYVKQTSGLPVHLLGGSHMHPTELRDEKWPINVRSTDTSAPFNYAYAMKKLRQNNRVLRPDRYFELTLDDFSREYLDYNVNVIRSWTS